jgi:glycosyltransferase involved in cell wall biosynthesis
LRRCLSDAGYRIVDFRPHISFLGDVEAELRLKTQGSLVWVPCFRQRDLRAARRFSTRRQVPLVFDPLISAYDKQVFERGKISEDSTRARRLRQRERQLFALADLVLADTEGHAEFFRDALEVSEQRIRVVPMSADEALFQPTQANAARGDAVEVLFFGSFIPLQGPEVIVEAANRYQGPPVRWRLLGDGPLLAACRARVRSGVPIEFEEWLPYRALPARIAQADIVLGIFGNTPKSSRVVPNKVCQALACGRPLVTRASPAYAKELRAQADSGITWVPPDDPDALARAVAGLASAPQTLRDQGARAHASYRAYFSTERVAYALSSALASLAPTLAQ